MKEGLVDAGLGGNLLHAGAGGAAADENHARRLENALLGVAVAPSLDRLIRLFSHLV
jgi:hypothetical protein